MPTYDYKCNACGHTFEHFQSMKDKSLRKCPKCGKNALERLIGIGAAVVFKGSGFYQTDYRSEGYKKSAEADKTAASGGSSESGSSGKDSSSKPETKTEASTGAKTESKSETKSESKSIQSSDSTSGSTDSKSKRSDSRPAKSSKSKK